MYQLDTIKFGVVALAGSMSIRCAGTHTLTVWQRVDSQQTLEIEIWIRWSFARVKSLCGRLNSKVENFLNFNFWISDCHYVCVKNFALKSIRILEDRNH